MALTTSLFALSFGLSQQIFAEENPQNLNNEESQEVQNNSNQDEDYNDANNQFRYAYFATDGLATLIRLIITGQSGGAVFYNRLALRMMMAEGNLAEEDASFINSKLKSLDAIEARLQSGELTKEEATAEAEEILNTMPKTPKPSLKGLLSSWEDETEVILKTYLAKEIQGMVGVEADGLIGRKTIAAIKSKGIEPKIRIPTRQENSNFKIAIEIAEGIDSGELTEEEAVEQIDAINSGLDSMREIGQRVQSGELTEEEARKQV